MTSALISKDTYTRQVVKYLERQIETGALPPLTKLASVRKMAGQFNVSVNVILFALEELEKKRLIHREERKGIFVSEMASNPEVTEVLILVFGDDPEQNYFIRETLSLISCPAAQGKLNFFTRVVTSTRRQRKDLKFMQRQLRAEIAKLSQTFHSDCAVIIGPYMDRAQIMECMKLPFPFLFIGNFRDGDYADLSYNRLGFVPDYYDAAVEYAAVNRFKSVKLVIADILKDAPLTRAALESAQALCRNSGLEMEVIYQSDSRSEDPRVCQASREQIVKSVLANSHQPEVVTFSCVLDVQQVIADLESAGYRPEPGVREFILTGLRGDTQGNPAIKRYKKSEHEIDEFNAELCSTLQKLAGGELDNYREDYSYSKIVR